jgi:NitT/TauT family transport system substrate-binding protein
MRFLSIKPLIVIICLFMAACSEPNTQTLRIGTNVWPGYEPLYLARELGYFNKNDIRLIEYTSASQVLKAYRNGLLDSAAITLDEAIVLREAGEDFRIVLAMDESNGADALLGQASLKSIDELKGKRIGVEHTALGAYFLYRIIELTALDKNDITIVSQEVNQHVRAFKEKQVDAVITFEPARSEIIENGGNVLFDSTQIPGEIIDVLIVRAEKIKLFEKNIDGLKRGWFKAVGKMQNSPNEYAKTIDKRMRVGEKNVMAMFEGLAFPDKEKNEFLLNSMEGESLIHSSRKMAKIMSESGLIGSIVDTDVMFKPVVK